jgi:lactoylglutathione lyase
LEVEMLKRSCATLLVGLAAACSASGGAMQESADTGLQGATMAPPALSPMVPVTGAMASSQPAAPALDPPAAQPPAAQPPAAQPPAQPPAAQPTAPADPVPAANVDPRSRIAFVSFYVSDLDASLDYYTRLLGMKERVRAQLADGTTQVMIGYPEAENGAELALLSNPERQMLQHGDAYSRFGMTVDDIAGLIAQLRSEGATIMQQPTRTESLGLSYAMIRDPDDYLIELLQYDDDPAAQAMAAPLPRIGFLSFNVADQVAAVDFYSRTFGMEERGSFNVGNGTVELFVGFADEMPGEASLVLLANANRRAALQHGDAFSRFGVRVADLPGFTTKLEADGIAIAQPATRTDALGLTSALIQDVDDFKIEVLQYD